MIVGWYSFSAGAGRSTSCWIISAPLSSAIAADTGSEAAPFPAQAQLKHIKKKSERRGSIGGPLPMAMIVVTVLPNHSNDSQYYPPTALR